MTPDKSTHGSIKNYAKSSLDNTKSNEPNRHKDLKLAQMLQKDAILDKGSLIKVESDESCDFFSDNVSELAPDHDQTSSNKLPSN